MRKKFKLLWCWFWGVEPLAVALSLALVFVSAAAALDPRKSLSQYARTVYSSDNGLPQASVAAIYQTRDGYMWFATQEGLVRFNGSEFQIFSTRNTPAFRNNYVAQLMEDRSGALWIGTAGGGLLRHRKGRFESFGNEQGLTSSVITAIHEDQQGQLWVGTSDGVFRLRGTMFEHVSVPDHMLDGQVTAIEQDHNGSLWFGFSTGLVKLEGRQYQRVQIPSGPGKLGVEQIWMDKNGDLLIGTAHKGFFRLNGQSTIHYGALQGLPQAPVHAFLRDRNGSLWVGTLRGGLCRQRGEQFDCYRGESGLPDTFIQTLVEDHDGNLWVGVFVGGVVRFSDTRFTTIGALQGIKPPMVQNVLQARDKTIWAGTAQGLYRIQGGTIKRFINPMGAGSNDISAIYEDRNGRFWIGSQRAGAYLFEKDRFSRFAKPGFSIDGIRAFQEDQSGAIWIGGEGGLALYKGDKEGEIKMFTIADGLPSNEVLALYTDRSNNLWIGTADGVSRFSQGHFSTVYTSRDFHHLAAGASFFYEDAEDVLWIATSGSGLIRVKSDKATAITTGQGMYDDTVYGIVEDAYGYLWMSSNRGIFRAKKSGINAVADRADAKVRVEAFGKGDGILDLECNGGGFNPPSGLASDGKLLFSNSAGILMIDPEDPAGFHRPLPPVVIEEIKANGKSIPENGSVPVGDGKLQFHFAALAYTNLEKIKLRYKLEPFEKDWIEAESHQTANYTNISPGAYTFRVTGATQEGAPGVEAASARFFLSPHFYQTWWFYTLCALSVGGIIVGVYRFRVRQLRARQKHLEEKIRERTAALQQTEEKYRGIFQEAIVGIFQTTPEGRYLSVNPAMARMFGFDSAEELMASRDDISLQSYVNPAERERFKRLIEARGLVENFQYEVYRKDGNRIWISENARAVRGSNGEVLYFVGTIEDITARKLTEERLQQEVEERKRAEEVAQAANQAKGTFLAAMSHEIRTPINGIMGMTDLLLDSQLTPGQRNDLTLIHLSADSLLTVINDILDFSKIEAGKLEFEKMPFDLRRGLGETMKALGVRAQQNGLELIYDVDAKVPHGVVGDLGRLRQVVVNLVGNAIKFTAEGEIVVRVFVQQDSLAARGLHFTVSDTGIGVPLEKRESIFKAFTQADNSITRKFGGTGLGLAVCVRLVRMMHGQIWVENRAEGRGSVFHFTAQLEPQEQIQPEVPEREASLFAGCNVLVVDDNRTSRDLLIKMLQQWDMKAAGAKGGIAALESLLQAEEAGKPFDLILLDAHMPGMNGFETLGRIGESRLKKTRVIMLTSAAAAGDAARCRELGMTAFTGKPILQAELYRAIVTAMGGNAELGDALSKDERRADAILRPDERLEILLVEDNRINQILCTRLLQKYGHRVRTADHGREGLAALEEAYFDLVLMDVEMPELDGLSVTKAIREQEEVTGNHIPIIGLTALAMAGDKERCLAAGMDGYVTKPIGMDELFRAIARLQAAIEKHHHMRGNRTAVPS